MSTDSITLPIKRVTDEPLEERLTTNVTQKILPARYLQTDAAGNIIETPQQLFERVAWNIAMVEATYGNDVEHWATRFEELMTRLEFMPKSPTLMNAGTDIQQLAACFVLTPPRFDRVDLRDGETGRHYLPKRRWRRIFIFAASASG